MLATTEEPLSGLINVFGNKLRLNSGTFHLCQISFFFFVALVTFKDIFKNNIIITIFFSKMTSSYVVVSGCNLCFCLVNDFSMIFALMKTTTSGTGAQWEMG